ncbi:nitrite reductase large subunit NirB [Magnetospirillum sulfuroxidans]|uniref:Nitrite reductase large subunit NirB n=1 Tax=Magnetospirillum sulfuroxidans TaxID=611300 RepID=A0ABS5I9D1_9PROT|nr:nitrite reductase large subunit NirB [Magnetospirillum sulfuroxidans]MBR9971016.1 nitrite reductase large subunit NirB [Magnetospirillum sulfuroxidans]
MNSVPRQRLVVIGNGMAGMRTVEELLARAPVRYDITVFGAEPHPNYNRIMLSSVLAGEKQIDDIIINPRAWYTQNAITLHAGDAVIGIDAKTKTVTAASGLRVAYDKLLLATGSKPLMPPLPGLDLPGIVTFRDIADIDKMLAAAEAKQRAVVIGGGLLGLEAAWGLKRRGMPVALVHLMPTLMERQLDTEAGTLLQRDLDERGLHFFTSGQTERIIGSERAEGVALADGRTVPGDLVVVAIGIRPNVDMGKAADVDINRGILVGDDMATSDPDIYAVGECVEHNGQVFGLVAPIWEQAKVCAARLAGDTVASYVTPALSTRLKITGIDVFSAGKLAAEDDGDEEVVFRDAAKGVYRKLVVRGNRLVGAVLYGDVADGGWYFDLIKGNKDVAEMRDRLIFGQGFADQDCCGGSKAGLNVAAMTDDTQVCGCNGVSKGAIVKAIGEKGLTTLDEVRAHTKASASCGMCTPTVQAILSFVTGSDAAAPEVMCKCTDHGHDHVRHAILDQRLKTMADLREALGWKTADGCAKCRPALNYYLLCAWPGEYVDDYRSRFINERVHANIQKDGTYSVIPRMWGGVTTPAELRAIADVADKFNIPTVKVTGGQRIDLLGVKKQDLPAVWGDLNQAGLVSGHGYAKGLRTVKTCVGSEWCRFGTQDSTALGIKLEKMMWGSWTPHKVKLAVSGCPRNCAEATIKDIGIICVEAGYDMVIGGNGGIEVRVTDPLTRLTTEAEVLEYSAAFMQLYREEGHYLERTAPYLERVGLAHIKARILEDDAGRKALYARFLFAQSFAQDDPWAERAGGGVDAHEFQSLAVVS